MKSVLIPLLFFSGAYSLPTVTPRIVPPEPTKYQVFITSYNPAVAQTDDSPCEGASGRNLCQAAKEGDKIIALSQDLLWWKGGPFRYHDKIKVVSDIPQCNGVYSLEDTMNARFTNMGDLFFMERKDNTSCNATIFKITY